jgi:hypothetical protein
MKHAKEMAEGLLWVTRASGTIKGFGVDGLTPPWRGVAKLDPLTVAELERDALTRLTERK